MHYSQMFSGCFGSSQDPLLGKRFNIELPLQKIHHYVQIINGVAEVEMHQTYVNKRQNFIEVQYKFPIMPSICLHKFVALFGKTRMEGVVKQKEAAKVEYKQAVNSGKKAAIGTIDPQSKDTMTLQIGNIGPFKQVKIQICYSEQLSISLNTFYQFNFPTKLIPKFIRNISKQYCLNSFRSIVKIGEGEGEFEWDFRVRLKASRKVIVHKSPTHQLSIEKNNHQNTQIEFTLSKGQFLSKDFIFLYTTEDFQIPSYTLGRTDISSSVMVSFIPKFCTLDLKDAQLAALKPESFETDIAGVKGQYIFLLDRSGSMGGSPIKKAKQALIMFLKSLPVDTFFQVVGFGTKHQFLFPSSGKNSNENINYAVEVITQWKADMNGTEIYRPLNQLLKSQLIEGYPKQIFLLTDGDVTDKNGVIELIRKNTKYTRVHAIGVGGDVSKTLIIGCAEKGKGHHTFIANGEDPSEKIIQLLNDSLTPIISKVSLKYDYNVVESIVPNPARLPYILKGEVVNFYLTFKGQLTVPTAFSLSYTDSLNGLPFTSQIQVLPESPSEAFVDKLGNFKRIKALEEAQENNTNIEQFLYFEKVIDKKQQIIELSTKHQILSKHTAFLCVEKELVDGRYEEIKDKGKQTIWIQDKVVQINQKKKKKLFEDEEDDIFSLKVSLSQNSPQKYYTKFSLQAVNSSGIVAPSYMPVPTPQLPPPLSVTPSQHFNKNPFAQNTKKPQRVGFTDFFGSASVQRSYNPTPQQQQINLKAPIQSDFFSHDINELFMKKQDTLKSNNIGFSDFNCIPQRNGLMKQQELNIKNQQNKEEKKTSNKLFGLGDSGGSSSNPPKASIQSSSVKTIIPPTRPPAQNLLDLMDVPAPSSLSLPPPPPVTNIRPPPPGLAPTLPSKKPNYADSLLQFASPPLLPPPPAGIIDLDACQLQSKIQFDFQKLPLPPPSPPSFDFLSASSHHQSVPTIQELLKQIQQPNAMSILKSTLPIAKPQPFFADSKQQQTSTQTNTISMPLPKDKIKQIVSEQQYQGKWSNIKLIQLLFGANLARELQNLAQKDVVITLLLAGWIEKNHKEKVYSLILKKAQSWLKKQEKYQHYQQQYEQYIK